jgi:hypothetical protein
MTTQMNNVIVTHRGWTISITDHKGFDPHGSNRKTREIGIWNPALGPNAPMDTVVYYYGSSAKELVHAIRYAQWQIDKTLFKSWIKSTLRLGA